MLLLAWCLVWAHATTSLMDCASYIGFRLRPVSGTSCTCLLMHMVHTGRCPPYLKGVLHPVSSSSGRSGLWSATTTQYVKPRLRTVFGERAFSFAGPKSWNYLPSLLHIVTSTDSFKRQLKTYLFNTLYSLQFDLFLVYYEVIVLLRRWSFYCNWRTTSFYSIVLYWESYRVEKASFSKHSSRLIYTVWVTSTKRIPRGRWPTSA